MLLNQLMRLKQLLLLRLVDNGCRRRRTARLATSSAFLLLLQ